MSTPGEPKHLRRLRALVASLPETAERRTWDHPTFRVRDKIFATFHEHEGAHVISVKQTKDQQAAWIEDPRFFPASYVGRFGWITLYADDVEWDVIEALVVDGYRQVAPKSLAKTVEPR